MSSLLKKVLPMLILFYTVLGESTQDENMNRRYQELEIKLAEQSAKISYLESDNSIQKTAINELMAKVALLDFKIAQEFSQTKVSYDERQIRLDKSVEHLQNSLIDEWRNITTSLDEKIIGKVDEIKTEIISRDENQLDQRTAIRQSVENQDYGRQKLQNVTIEGWSNISNLLNRRLNEIADEIKSEIISTIAKTSDNNNPMDQITALRQSMDTLTDLVTKTAGENQGRLQLQNLTQTLDYLTEVVNKTAIQNRDCKALYDSGVRLNGVYTISPFHGITFEVYCDMDDGGWTVIQNRFDGSTNFTRSWLDYRNGFGDLNKEYWLGLDKIYLLTNPSGRMLKVDMTTLSNRKLHVLYESFRIENARSSFTLRLGSYINGTIDSDSFGYSNNEIFTTYDHDEGNSCATECEGGWWFKSCAYFYLNGRHGNDNGMFAINKTARAYNYIYHRTSRMKLQ